MASKTIIYLTDNSLDEKIASLARTVLLKNAGDIPIISVSQKPLDFGKNICVGEIGRSWMSLYKQILTGLDAVETPYIGIAEHDCLYTPECLQWIPPQDDLFYYNSNCWFLQWGGNHPELNGMFSYWPKRHALSQLVCHKDLLRASTEEVMNLLNMGLKVQKGMKWYGEPGLVSEKFRAYVKKAFEKSVSGENHQLQRYLKKYVTDFHSMFFKTEAPNLDIRHGSNFTGPKRGIKRRYELPYWGKFENILGVANG